MFDPERYESNKSMSAAEVDYWLPKLIKSLSWSKNENILDYGCGAGSTGFNYILPQAALTDSTMYSVDCSETMLAYARKHYADNSIVYKRGNILEEFPFKNIKFDKIITIHVLHFISDIHGTLKGFHNILKSGGQFGFTCTTVNTWMCDSYRILASSETWGKYMKGYEVFMPEWCTVGNNYETTGLKKLFEGAGFRVKELVATERKFDYEDIGVFLELCMACNPRLGNFPKELIPSLKEDLRKMMIKFADIAEDSTTITYPVEYVCGILEKS